MYERYYGPRTYSLSEAKWLTLHCRTDILKYLISKKAILVADLQICFDRSADVLSPWTVDLLLGGTVQVKEKHFTLALDETNLSLLQLLVKHCRKWNPCSCIVHLQRLQQGSYIEIIQWIVGWLNSFDLPVTPDHITNEVEKYKAFVGVVTNNGRRERRCKRVAVWS